MRLSDRVWSDAGLVALLLLARMSPSHALAEYFLLQGTLP